MQTGRSGEACFMNVQKRCPEEGSSRLLRNVGSPLQILHDVMSRKTGNINEALRTPESRILKSFETAEERTVLMDAASGIKFIMRIGNYTKSEERSFSVL